MRANNGSIVFSLLLILVLVTLGAAIMVRSMNEHNVAMRFSNSTQSLWLADAGVQKALYDYKNNSCHGFVQQGTSTACTSCSSCGGGNKTMAVSISGAGDYDVILNSANTTITSTGSVPTRSSSSKVQRNVQATLGSQVPYAYGIFAQGQVTLANNTYVDSYNSSNGNYTVASSTTNGDIGTNGTTAGIISIGTGITVGGSVSTGPSGTVTIGAHSVITGTQTHANVVSLPDVTIPSSLSSLTSGGDLTLSNGGTKTLTAGDYKYSKIDINNVGTLNITGGVVRIYLTGATSLTANNNADINIASGSSVQFFVDGTFDVDNNGHINISGTVPYPKNVQVYSTYTGGTAAKPGVTINNNGDLFGAIYAPQTNIDVGNNGDVYGSLIGKTVKLGNNAAVHYDEALKTLTSLPVGTTGITTWQEL